MSNIYPVSPHMRWQVAISNFTGDVRLLRDVLAGFSGAVVEEDGQQFLASSEFEGLETSGDVRKCAEQMVTAINAASYGELADQLHVTLGSAVREHRTDGQRLVHHVVMATTVTMNVTLHPLTMSATAS